jgi:hypothetical protein
MHEHSSPEHRTRRVNGGSRRCREVSATAPVATSGRDLPAATDRERGASRPRARQELVEVLAAFTTPRTRLVYKRADSGPPAEIRREEGLNKVWSRGCPSHNQRRTFHSAGFGTVPVTYHRWRLPPRPPKARSIAVSPDDFGTWGALVHEPLDDGVSHAAALWSWHAQPQGLISRRDRKTPAPAGRGVRRDRPGSLPGRNPTGRRRLSDAALWPRVPRGGCVTFFATVEGLIMFTLTP